MSGLWNVDAFGAPEEDYVLGHGRSLRVSFETDEVIVQTVYQVIVVGRAGYILQYRSNSVARPRRLRFVRRTSVWPTLARRQAKPRIGWRRYAKVLSDHYVHDYDPALPRHLSLAFVLADAYLLDATHPADVLDLVVAAVLVACPDGFGPQQPIPRVLLRERIAALVGMLHDSEDVSPHLGGGDVLSERPIRLAQDQYPGRCPHYDVSCVEPAGARAQHEMGFHQYTPSISPPG